MSEASLYSSPKNVSMSLNRFRCLRIWQLSYPCIQSIHRLNISSVFLYHLFIKMSKMSIAYLNSETLKNRGTLNSINDKVWIGEH